MTDFEKFGLQPYPLEPTTSKVLVAYGRNSMGDLASSNDTPTNDADGRIVNKTWCKCECCAPMETSIEKVCYLEIYEIYKPRFSGTLCLYVCRSNPHFIQDIMCEKTPLTVWFPSPFDPCQTRIYVLYRFKVHRFLWLGLRQIIMGSNICFNGTP